MYRLVWRLFSFVLAFVTAASLYRCAVSSFLFVFYDVPFASLLWREVSFLSFLSVR